jgi:hypothetical protein
VARFPSKGGSSAGRRQFFRNMGSSEAGAPGTKSSLRKAKHRVATVQCTGTSASGTRCKLPAGHTGYHRIRTGAAMMTSGKSRTGRHKAT